MTVLYAGSQGRLPEQVTWLLPPQGAASAVMHLSGILGDGLSCETGWDRAQRAPSGVLAHSL